MSMSKKHFIALADQMRDVLTTRNGECSIRNGRVMVPADDVIGALCAFMRGQNGAFNESRWRAYLAGECGPSGGRIKKAKVSA
jgi:hypothetical protein